MKSNRLAAVLWVLVIVLSSVIAYRYYLVHELRKPVLAELNDPESAQFRNERVFSNWTVSGGALCGEINARNRMGGFVGFNEFTVVAGLAMIDDENTKQYRAATGRGGCDFKSITPWWHISW
jgi:hypothetical protein